MVLRIKEREREREESIQLLAMDSQVCGKLLTLHRKGNRVDVEALCDRIPLRQGAGKGRWDLTGTEGCGGGKVFQWMPLLVWGYMGIYRQKDQVKRVMGAPQGWGRALLPWACPPSLWPPRGSSDFVSKSPGSLLVQEKSSQRFYSVWTRFRIPFLRNSKTRKNRNWHWALG